MKRLWAPWRSKYVESIGESSECFLCEAVKQPEERLRDYLVLYKGKRAFVIFNKYPYNPGHLMVAPIDHRGDYTLLDEDTALEMHKLVKVCLLTLRRALNPHGFNLGFNLGRSAGAGLETHIHLHIVPRWNGDTNFMSTLAETRVISQDLWEMYDRIRPIFFDILHAAEG